MAEFTLIPHPDTPPRSTEYVGVSIRQDRHGLNLCYVIGGPTAQLVIPATAAPQRTDDLWRTTCLELFVSTGSTGYQEFNFAPSGAWAGYRFADYRSGMAALPLDPAPRIIISDEGDALIVAVRIAAPVQRETMMALTAVIEERDGTKTYWALAHGDGPPDFHDPDCFVAPLPAPSAA